MLVLFHLYHRMHTGFMSSNLKGFKVWGGPFDILREGGGGGGGWEYSF